MRPPQDYYSTFSNASFSTTDERDREIVAWPSGSSARCHRGQCAVSTRGPEEHQRSLVEVVARCSDGMRNSDWCADCLRPHDIVDGAPQADAEVMPRLRTAVQYRMTRRNLLAYQKGVLQMMLDVVQAYEGAAVRAGQMLKPPNSERSAAIDSPKSFGAKPWACHAAVSSARRVQSRAPNSHKRQDGPTAHLERLVFFRLAA